MAVVKPSSSRSFRAALRYISKQGKTHEHLMTGIRCCSDPKQALIEWQVTKKVYGQTTGRSCIVMIQSWAAAEQITPELAHQIGVETVNRWNKYNEYQVFVATHLDQQNGNLHNHIASNSVNMETGKKWQMTKQELAELRALSDQICREHGLTVTVKGKTFEQVKNEEPSIYKNETYRILHRADEGKADSWVYNTAANIIDAMQQAFSKEHFCELLEKAGVMTTWTEARKNITFQRKEGIGKQGKLAQKIRDSKLAQYFKIDFSKEFFENEFNQNLQRAKAKERVGVEGAGAAEIEGRNAEPTGRAESSILDNSSIAQLGLDAAASAAARAERERAERERREADERARELAEKERREREAAAAAARRAAAERKAARANGSSIAD